MPSMKEFNPPSPPDDLPQIGTLNGDPAKVNPIIAAAKAYNTRWEKNQDPDGLIRTRIAKRDKELNDLGKALGKAVADSSLEDALVAVLYLFADPKVDRTVPAVVVALMGVCVTEAFAMAKEKALLARHDAGTLPTEDLPSDLSEGPGGATLH